MVELTVEIMVRVGVGLGFWLGLPFELGLCLV